MDNSIKGHPVCAVNRIDPSRDSQWSALVRSHANAAPAHLGGWARMLLQNFTYLGAVYLGLRRNGRLEAGLPLFHIHSRLAGNRLVSVPFATFADPLVESKAQLIALLDAARAEADRLGACRIELRCTKTADMALECGMVPTRKFKIHVLYLDKDQDPAALLKKFDRSCVRQQINKSLKCGLQFRPACGKDDFAAFYRLYVLTRKRLRLPPLPPELFAGLLRELGAGGNAEILLALRDGLVLGGLFTLRLGRRISFEHIGVDPGIRNPSMFHFLYWNGILRAVRQGCDEVDFGRTDENNTGLMNFKKRWNTEVSDLVHFDLLTSGAQDQDACTTSKISRGSLRYRILQRACELAPRPAFIGLGRLCYRHYV